MTKENIIECIICGIAFNNYYKTGKLRKQTCSRKCYREIRRIYHYNWTKKKRKERIKNKCCVNCGKKVKPKIIISYRCEECLEKIRKNRRK